MQKFSETLWIVFKVFFFLFFSLLNVEQVGDLPIISL